MLKKIEILNPIHPGFYGSIINTHSNGREEEELYYEPLSSLAEKNDLIIEYDYREYESLVSSEINDLFIKIVNEAVYDKLGIRDLLGSKVHEELTSPREYNFETDKSYLTVEVDKYKWNQFINTMFNKYYCELETYIWKHHSSCDGFISFYSNDVDTWRSKKYNLDYNELKSIFICFLEEVAGIDMYNEEIMYDLLEISTNIFYEMELHYMIEGDTEVFINFQEYQLVEV